MTEKTHLLETLAAFLRPRTPREMRLFLEDILTPQEFKSAIERFLIFKMLAMGATQREISSKLKVSISKVIRGARAWRTSEGGIKAVLKQFGTLR